MQIRKATQTDVDAIASLHHTARKSSMPWLPVLHTPAEDIWFFKTIVLTQENVWVASDGAHLTGFVSFRDDWLNHLYVDPTCWRHGIGFSLLEKAKQTIDRLQLWTFQKNTAASRFYESQGFVAREATDGQNNEEKTPDIRMVWRRQQ